MGRTRYMSTAHDAMAKPRSFPDFHRKIVMPASATSKPMMNVGAFGIRGSIGGKIEGAVVVTVSVEVADADPGVTVGCESEHDDREGVPEQASVAGLVNAPNWEPIVTV